MINKLKKQLRGFTLIETLVAVLLLSTAVAGPLTIASKSLIAALVAKDQVTAFFLAQDAVEFVRFARDTNKLRGATNWLTGAGGSPAGVNLSNCINTVSAGGCTFDSADPGTIQACSNCGTPITSTSNFLRQNNGRYQYTTGTVTPFVRQVIITELSASEITLEVTVRWRDATKERFVTVRENMFDWQ